MKKIIHKLRIFKTGTNLSRCGFPVKFTPRSDCARFREIFLKSKRYISDSTDLSKLNIQVHDSPVRKLFKKYGLFGRIPKRKSLHSEKNMAAKLRFAEIHLNKPHLNNVL